MGIRALTRDDLVFASSLTVEEGWNYTPRELEIMLKIDPDGSFIYEDEEPLGFATSVTYSRTGVIGHLIVSKKGRGRRIGDILLEATIEHMADMGARSMILYATHEAVRMYKRHGFEPQEEISCMHLHIDDSHRSRRSPLCMPMRKSDLPEVMAIDQEQFGDDRKDLIEVIYQEGPQHSFKIEKNGRVAGYIMGRHDHDGYDLGPWACTTGDPKDAEALFWTELSTFKDPTIYMGSFVKNRAALRITEGVPRIRSWHIPLMVRGEMRYASDLSSLFGIAAFELG
jgi:ribosomal protein S18 acetylase RimI-like enzyme